MLFLVVVYFYLILAAVTYVQTFSL